MSHHIVYIMTESNEEALRIGRALVRERLAACANVLSDATSVYRWQDDIVEETEVPLIVKTREDLIEDVIGKVVELHSYECPCIVALKIQQGNVEFLDWISRETSQNFKKDK